MRITTRVIAVVATAITALSGIGALALHNLVQADHRYEAVESMLLPRIDALNLATRRAAELRLAGYQYGMNRDEAVKGRLRQSIVEIDGKIVDAFDTFERQAGLDEANRRLLAAGRDAYRQYRDAREKVLEMDVDPAQMQEHLLKRVKPLGDVLNRSLDEHIAHNVKIGAQYAQANREAYAQSLWTFGSVLSLAGVTLVVSGLLMVRRLGGSLGALQGSMESVCRSLDFTHRVRVSGTDELARTAEAFNALLDRLQTNLKEMHQGARAVAAASGSMKALSAKVSSAVSRQSESASKIASTVEQLTVSVTEVGARASETQSIANDAGGRARSGSEIIGQTVADIRSFELTIGEAAQTLQKLQEQGNQVDAIVRVIKDVADQTNLLALNAAIEAARAGEAGRGFAVVANEVRNLAERTAQSTAEIAATIDAMKVRSRDAAAAMATAQQVVKASAGRADEADGAMQSIGNAVGTTAVLVSEIADAIREQGIASNDIASDIERIARMAEEASAAASRTATDAQDLERQANLQLETLSAYRL